MSEPTLQQIDELILFIEYNGGCRDNVIFVDNDVFKLLLDTFLVSATLEGASFIEPVWKERCIESGWPAVALSGKTFIRIPSFLKTCVWFQSDELKTAKPSDFSLKSFLTTGHVGVPLDAFYNYRKSDDEKTKEVLLTTIKLRLRA